jgi:Fic family protein
MPPYIYARPEWPEFTFDPEAVTPQLAAVRHLQGHLLGRMEGLGFTLRSQATLESLTEEVLKSSEIEGESLDRDQVRNHRLPVDWA